MESQSFILFVGQAAEIRIREVKSCLPQTELYECLPEAVTGVVVYRQGMLLQYLEGLERNVFSLYQALRARSDLFNLRVLTKGTLQQRLFQKCLIQISRDELGPSSQSLIDLFETVFSYQNPGVHEISVVLKRFSRNSECILLPSFNSQALNSMPFLFQSETINIDTN